MEERFSLINRRLALLEEQVHRLSEALGVSCPTFASDGEEYPTTFVDDRHYARRMSRRLR
jgi:hypothetical protein